MVAYLDAHYARLADAIERGPQYYGGDPSVVALRCFRRYHKDATVDLQDGFGRGRWVTRKQARIHAVLLRAAVAGTTISMQAVARETRVCPSTVSRAVLKFQAWGIFAVDITRGRSGGMRIVVGAVDSYIDRARARLHAIATRAVNVAFTLTMRTRKDLAPSNSRDATFSFRVLTERRRLALVDPYGERDAVSPIESPMSDDEIADMLDHDKRRRQEQLRRQAAFDGNWTLWDRIGAEIERGER